MEGPTLPTPGKNSSVWMFFLLPFIGFLGFTHPAWKEQMHFDIVLGQITYLLSQ